jgi:spore coat protein CotH
MIEFRRALVCSACLVLSVLALGLPSSQAQSTDAAAALFDDSRLHTVQLRMNADDWQTLKDNYGRDTYYPADFVWDGQVVRNAGIRSRGSGTRNPQKPGLKIDFNQYVDQKFLGLTNVILDNFWQDASFLRERVTMKFYARIGLPAPREAFTRLFINDEYVGVYALVEDVDKRFLKRVGYDDKGYLFEYNWTDLWWFDYLGDDLEPYGEKFEAKTHEDDGDTALLGPIETFVYTVNEPHQIVRDIGEFLDIPQFLRFLAVEAFLAEWDGLVGDFGINNFYLYRSESNPMYHFIPWDKDNTFKKLDYPVWPDGMDNNVLTRQLMNVDSLQTDFLKAVLACADSADERVGDTNQSWLQREIEAEYAQIREAALVDPKKRTSNDDFEYAVELLREFARERPGVVRAQVGVRMRRGEN